jgi:hypothetical protein
MAVDRVGKRNIIFTRHFYHGPPVKHELIKLRLHRLNQCHWSSGGDEQSGLVTPQLKAQLKIRERLLLQNPLKPALLRPNNNQEFIMAKGNRSQKKEIKKKKKEQPKTAPPTRRGI